MEMASHEKASERERARGRAPSLRPPASRRRAHGRARAHAWVRTCGPGGWGLRVRVRGGAGAVPPHHRTGGGAGASEQGGCEAPVEGVRGQGGGLPAGAEGLPVAPAAVWLQGTAPLPGAADQSAGGEGAGLCEQRPWPLATPPSRSAPLGVC